METLMAGAMFIEVAFLSFFLALWAAWLGLSGLFRLLPVTSRTVAPVRYVANRRAEYKTRRAA